MFFFIYQIAILTVISLVFFRTSYYILNLIQYKVHVQINVYTNVPHTVRVLFILSKISKDNLRTCLRAFEADIPKIFKNVHPQTKNSTFL